MANQNPEAPRLSNEKRNFDQVEKRDADSLSNDLQQVEDDPVEAKKIIRKVDWRVRPAPMIISDIVLTATAHSSPGSAVHPGFLGPCEYRKCSSLELGGGLGYGRLRLQHCNSG
jgi:hypothetical protein